MLSADGLLVELALSGRLDQGELCRWLEPLGIGGQVAVLAFALPDPHAGLPALEHCLRRAGARGLVAVYEGLLCVVVDCTSTDLAQTPTSTDLAQPPASERPSPAGPPGRAGEQAVSNPLALAARARGELSGRLGEVRAAASRPAPASMLRRSFHEARCALDAARTINGGALDVSSYDDLGALKLLLSLQPQQALESYCQIVLGPVEGEDHSYGEELLRSLDAFIEHNGHWEHAAKALYCHRHTLRYRVRRVEQLTGRDFSRARDRIELWLALRGRELMR
jgi:PucR family transcriptional regulator, purine catabolism regulatory protein